MKLLSLYSQWGQGERDACSLITHCDSLREKAETQEDKKKKRVRGKRIHLIPLTSYMRVHAFFLCLSLSLSLSFSFSFLIASSFSFHCTSWPCHDNQATRVRSGWSEGHEKRNRRKCHPLDGDLCTIRSVHRCIFHLSIPERERERERKRRKRESRATCVRCTGYTEGEESDEDCRWGMSIS